MKSVLLLLIFALPVTLIAQSPHHSFALGDEQFLLDGKPFQIIAGEMHFARIPHQYWRHRLQMAKAMGLNTVATYVFWNYHELQPGQFDFTNENRNIREFIKTAQEEGLYVLLRPGPYACAEWEFGGYPWWLLKDTSLVVRGRDQRFLDASARYLDRLGKEVGDLQITKGGPIVMVQVENEYGSFGSDSTYMAVIRDMVRHAGFEVPLNRADGPSQCKAGAVAGVLPSIDGEDNPAALRDTVKMYHEGKGPFYVSEYYPGWLDNWGLKHSIVPVNDFVHQYDTLLMSGASVSLYVVHGGTNFGFMNGANYDREHPILPQPTTYDYDAPVDESGRATEKYFVLRETIQKHLSQGITIPPLPPAPTLITIPTITLSRSASLWDHLRKPAESDHPLSFEDMNQGYGFVLYSAHLPSIPAGGATLRIDGLRDYAIVFVEHKRVGILDRRLGQDTLHLPASNSGTLDILVENLGRINYGGRMVENRKGILQGVSVNGSPLGPWKMFPFPLEDQQDEQDTAQLSPDMPVFRTGSFTLKSTGETFLDMRQWGKGVVWVNGHNVGRYWNIGPQQTLYVPGCWLSIGENTITVFEMLNGAVSSLAGLDSPILNQLREATVDMAVKFDSLKSQWRVSMQTDDSTDTIFYTTDGTEPTTRSIRYSGGFTLNSSAAIRARARRGDFVSAGISQRDIVLSLSTGKPVQYTIPFTPKYSGEGMMALTNGLTGSLNFRDGQWQGFQGIDCNVTIDLGEIRDIHTVGINFLQDVSSWIFLPRHVEIEVSEDNKSF